LLGLYVVAEQLRGDVVHFLALFVDATAAAHSGGRADALQVGSADVVAQSADVHGHVSVLPPAVHVQFVEH